MIHRFMIRSLVGVLGFISISASAADWPAKFARVAYVTANGPADMGYYGPNANEAWEDVIAGIAELNHTDPRKTTISPEYIVYAEGATGLLAPAVYSNTMDNFAPYDLRGTPERPWITFVQAQDQSEANCLKVSVVKGKVQGCGDVWQGGLQDNELACLDDQTYIRCHLECMEKLHNVKLGYASGACKKF